MNNWFQPHFLYEIMRLHWRSLTDYKSMKCSGSTLCGFSILLEIFLILNIPLFLHPLLFWHKFYAFELHVKPPAAHLCRKLLPLPPCVLYYPHLETTPLAAGVCSRGQHPSADTCRHAQNYLTPTYMLRITQHLQRCLE